MKRHDLVFIGIDVVADALDVAESRRWTRKRAPRGLWRRLGVGTGVVVCHPDAPLDVAIAPADGSLRGAAGTVHGDLRVRIDGDLFDEIVDDCPVIDELVSALSEADVSAHAA